VAEGKTVTDGPIEEAARLFAVLSDPTRLALVRLLSRQDETKPLCVGALARRLGVSQPAVSQHLRVLKDVGLVRGERRGPRVHYFLDPEAVASARKTVGGLLTLTADGEVCRDEC